MTDLVIELSLSKSSISTSVIELSLSKSGLSYRVPATGTQKLATNRDDKHRFFFRFQCEIARYCQAWTLDSVKCPHSGHYGQSECRQNTAPTTSAASVVSAQFTAPRLYRLRPCQLLLHWLHILSSSAATVSAGQQLTRLCLPRPPPPSPPVGLP